MTSGLPGGTGHEPRADARLSRPLIQRLWRILAHQRSLFLMVGAANTLFATLLFAGLVLLFGPSVPSVVSLVIAWLVSLLTGFFGHRLLVFRVQGHLLRDLLRYASVNYVSLLINAGALTLLSDVLGLPPIPVQVGIVCFVIVFTYVGHKFFSFRRQP